MISLRVYLDSGKPSFRADHVFAESIKALILRPCVKKVSFTVQSTKTTFRIPDMRTCQKTGGKFVCVPLGVLGKHNR